MKRNFMTTKSNRTRARSADTGRFVTKDYAKRHPNTTVKEDIGGGSNNGAMRSAKTGRFANKDYARKNPKTTMRDS